MKIRLGYVAISNTLNITSSSDISYTNFIKENNYEKLDKIIISNLLNLKQILIYNVKNNIHFYRLTSKLIPLATHNGIDFEYKDRYKFYYNELGKIINENNLRIDTHPDQFAVLNSTKQEVVQNTINIIHYHHDILSSLNIQNKIIILHIGSSVLGKDNSIKRFINNFNKLPLYLKKEIALENDDKIFNTNDVLNICKKLNIPMVLDVHHAKCTNDLNIDYKEIFDTWKNINPKIHFSSPKSKLKKEFRSHSEYINSDDFINFIEEIKNLNCDIDIILESKGKDESLFRLVREIKYKTDYKFIDETTFKI